jgi:hypothetical protein
LFAKATLVTIFLIFSLIPPFYLFFISEVSKEDLHKYYPALLASFIFGSTIFSLLFFKNSKIVVMVSKGIGHSEPINYVIYAIAFPVFIIMLLFKLMSNVFNRKYGT